MNEGLQVFDKSTGTSVLGPVSIESLWSGFGGVCETNGEGDPVVLYDQLANRWVVTQFAGMAQPTHECVAVSTSDDATGAYNRYDFDLGSAFGNNFYDYPKLSVWPDAYYMSINIFNASGTAFLGPQPFAMDRSAMLNGRLRRSSASRRANGPTEDQLMPADLDGSIQPDAGAPNPFTEIGTNQTWKLWRFHVDFATPANSTFTLAGTLTPDSLQRGLRAAGLRPAGGRRRPARHARRPQHVPQRLPSLRRRPRGARREHDGRLGWRGGSPLVGDQQRHPGTPGFVQQSTYQPDNT